MNKMKSIKKYLILNFFKKRRKKKKKKKYLRADMLFTKGGRN